MQLNEFSADLHVHTFLSPCAELEMSPLRITERAGQVGLDMIAVCDHNSAANAGAVIRAAREGLTVIPGMEITTSEEVHIVALFPTLDSALDAQAVVYEHLPGTNDEKAFGPQVLADENDEVLGLSDRLLIGATQLALREVVDLIHLNGGLAIAAHIDREAFGLPAQLGFFPPDLELDALEISVRADKLTARAAAGELFGKLALVRASDAHRLGELGTARTVLVLAEASFDELRKALAGKDGRAVRTEVN